MQSLIRQTSPSSLRILQNGHRVMLCSDMLFVSKISYVRTTENFIGFSVVCVQHILLRFDDPLVRLWPAGKGETCLFTHFWLSAIEITTSHRTCHEYDTVYRQLSANTGFPNDRIWT